LSDLFDHVVVVTAFTIVMRIDRVIGGSAARIGARPCPARQFAQPAQTLKDCSAEVTKNYRL